MAKTHKDLRSARWFAPTTCVLWDIVRAMQMGLRSRLGGETDYRHY